VARLRLFGPARDAAGVAEIILPGRCVSDVVAAAEERFGDRFSRILESSRIWVNGDDAERDAPVNDTDEIAVIPPVSGGCA
jgi:molybdopterin converting factor small subunit